MNCHKKRRAVKIILGLACSCVLGMSIKTVVFAGDINAEEQRIVDYYNRTFTYQGKKYVATDAAKQAAYNKLIADGTDLTAAQADSMILQASKNIAQGIKEGYLVEVPSETEEQEDNRNTDNKNTDEPENQKADDQNANEQDGKEAETKNDEEDGQSADSQENDKNKSGNEADKNQQNKTEDKRKSIDIDKLWKAVEEENNYGIVQSQDGPVTIEQYLSGKMAAVSEDGTLWYQSSLPIKNTGYADGKIWIIPIILVTGAGIISLLGWKLRKKKILWAVLPTGFTVIVIAMLGAGGRDTLLRQMAEWKTVWIAGAPEYQYEENLEGYIVKKEETQEEAYPLPDSQYGQIICKEINLKAPLYYGDGEEILEQGIGTWRGGYLPGEAGTVLVSGHDTSYFAPLEEIQKGDILTVDTIYGSYEYQVTGIKTADILDTEAYEIKEQDEQMILYTCYPFGKTGELRNQRFFVYAQRIDSPESRE